MARKSPWQEFAENFDAVYGTFQKVGKNIETSRITGDEFTEEGGLGFGLKGDALERARYKALGDIYTKYGEADKGLAIRQQLMNLEEARRANDINAATLQEQIRQTGILKSQLMESNINKNNAAAALSSQRAAEISRLLGPKYDQAVALARQQGYKADIEGVNAWLAQNTKGKTLEDQIAELNKSIRTNEAIIAAADGEVSLEQEIIANREGIIADSKIKKITAENEDEKQKAEIESIKAGTGLTGAQTEKTETETEITEKTKDTTIQATNVQNQVNIAESEAFLAFKELNQEAFGQELQTRLTNARAQGNAAKLQEIESAAFLKYAKDYKNGLYETGKDAANAFISIVGQFDPTRAAKLANEYTAEEIGKIANNGLMIQNEVSSFLQNQDFVGLAEYFDKKNGTDFGITLTRTEGGGVKIVEVAEGEVVATLVDAPDVATALQDVQALTTFGNAGGYAELLFSREKGQAELNKVIASTENLEAGTTYQNILNDTAKYTEILKQENTKVRTSLANAQIEKLKQEVAQEAGLTWNDKVAQRAYNSWVTGDTYAVIAESLSEEPQKLLEYTNRVKQGLGLISAPPTGVSNEEWLSMTDVQRAEFIRLGN
tara:strand:- start:1788 stop:3608 length:1821 start_codon:yes stop_codon:yes gene_type:complete